VREVKEELGLDVFALRPVRKLRYGQFELQVFTTQAFEGEVTPDPAEIRAWRFVQPHRLRSLETTPQLNEVIEAVFRMFDRT
jgi:8-oxo-dGTP pyrophosphatase MutT (NUDIX family)